jgi:undecaprenyl-diphosphatase
MTLLQILVLAIIQGAAELLPISSSAHVIVAEKLMGLDPTAPEMTLLLVMLHTGTMFAVIVYFWRAWRASYFSSLAAFRAQVVPVVVATVVTGVVGLALQELLKHLVAGGSGAFEVERLFGNLKLIAAALAAVGLLIILAARRPAGSLELSPRAAAWVGAVQGLCLPFRGFSRSGATISTGLLLGISRRRAEEFSFALAVVLTPVVIVRELHRLLKGHAAALASDPVSLWSLLGPSLIGALLSFGAGLLALRWLSRWLEQGRWQYFGAYCLIAAAVVLAIS